jgi:hypothetical protein
MAALDSELFAVGTNQITTNAAAQQVVAYYFHATVRCETCLLIERQAKAVIEEQFSAELAANRLKFASVNYELPENAHFLTDYKLPCPSLVLVRQNDGKDEKWKLLGQTWEFAHDPVRLNNYLATEVRKFLSGPASQSSTNQVELPRATQGDTAFVAQVSNLLYRRLPVGRTCDIPATLEPSSACGLEIRDTADWKSALQFGARIRMMPALHVLTQVSRINR